MKVFDVRDITAGVDAAFAAVDNPRHRHMLLEVSGHWQDILTPAMTVDHPVYRLTERGKTLVCDGMEEVRNFYSTSSTAA